jgi:hypothetical protein
MIKGKRKERQVEELKIRKKILPAHKLSVLQVS